MKIWRNGLVLAAVGIATARVVSAYRRRQRATVPTSVAAHGEDTRRAPAQGAPVRPPTSSHAPDAGATAEVTRPQEAGPTRLRVPGGPAVVATRVQPRRLPEGSHLSQVHFGGRGARKDRRKRTMARLGIVALIASLVGVPGVNLGLELLGDRLAAGEDPLTRADLRGVTTSESAEGLMRIRGDMFQSRPTPTPTPTEEPAPEPAVVEEEPAPVAAPAPAPAPAGSVTEILYAAAAEFGIDGSYLVAVASCESGLNPGAVNPAGYHGLFQFAESTWASYGYGSIYDATAQARTAARMLAAGMSSHWPNCA